MTILVVTGTDTDVGKTIATAALAASLSGSVAIYKPVQTGVAAGEPGDAEVAAQLSGAKSAETGIRLVEPMAPRQAAALEGAVLPPLWIHRRRVNALAASHDHVVVEGAGGLLVELGDDGHTITDVLRALPTAQAVLVTRAGLGTLNHTELTLEAVRRRRLPVFGLVIGAWPDAPTAIELANREHLEALAPCLGAIPAGSGSLTPPAFAEMCRGLSLLPAG